MKHFGIAITLLVCSFQSSGQIDFKSLRAGYIHSICLDLTKEVNYFDIPFVNSFTDTLFIRGINSSGSMLDVNMDRYIVPPGYVAIIKGEVLTDRLKWLRSDNPNASIMRPILIHYEIARLHMRVSFDCKFY